MGGGKGAPTLLLDRLGLTRPQRREADQAATDHPDGVRRLAEEALRAQAADPSYRAAALFLTHLRAGDHRLEHADPGPHRTGWRWVRGSHSGTFVADPNGTDRLPPGYDLTTRAPGPRPPLEDEPGLLTFVEWRATQTIADDLAKRAANAADTHEGGAATQKGS